MWSSKRWDMILPLPLRHRNSYQQWITRLVLMQMGEKMREPKRIIQRVLSLSKQLRSKNTDNASTSKAPGEGKGSAPMQIDGSETFKLASASLSGVMAMTPLGKKPIKRSKPLIFDVDKPLGLMWVTKPRS